MKLDVEKNLPKSGGKIELKNIRQLALLKLERLMAHYLDFEKPLAEIEGKAEELRAMARQNEEMDVEKEAENLDVKAQEILA